MVGEMAAWGLADFFEEWIWVACGCYLFTFWGSKYYEKLVDGRSIIELK